MPAFLASGPEKADLKLLLAHGAGAGMESPGMTTAAGALADAGVRVQRFEFGYMAARRTGGSRKPPPRAETLMGEYHEAVEALAGTSALFVGGKSMGGRVASMLADDLYEAGHIAGLVCLGYPFHSPAKPEQLRTRHLEALRCPALICQGTRDPFGTCEEVPGYTLSPAIEIAWFEDGDHDLKPRKSISGHTAAEHLATMGRQVAAWMRHVAQAPRKG